MERKELITKKARIAIILMIAKKKMGSGLA
jgi:hypothetical protein